MTIKSTTILVLFFLLGAISSLAQISGTVVDESSQEPLAFCTIYISQSTKGTTTNADGQYNLDLSPGTYDLVFQYIGYQTKTEQVSVPETGQLELNVTLTTQNYSLSEVQINADAEDPAYRVIRAAIKKRKYHLTQTDEYVADVYMKGNTEVLKAPKKVLGIDVGDMDGALDSNRQGIVYLSESVSKLYFQAPDRLKEQMISSKFSGNDQGYSFNSALDMDMNFYRNTIKGVNRPIVSPIANNALSFYNYSLEGTRYDDAGRLINKIKIIPKRNNDPICSGYIYIIEDEWNIESLSVNVLPEASRIFVLDTLKVEQQYIPVNSTDNQWLMFSNTATFDLNIFGFEFQGVFSAFYSNYDLSPGLDKKFFSNEVIKIEENSNQRDSSYWETTRPVPLTKKEEVDYVRKDSIYIARHTPEYLDSIDRKNNKLGLSSLLSGYSHQNTKKQIFWNVGSPLSKASFNTVQGYSIGSDVTVRKYNEEEQLTGWRATTSWDYGFSERKLRAMQKFRYLFNQTNFARVELSAGAKVEQYGGEKMITPIGNYFVTTLYRRNYMKLYDKRFAKASYHQEILNGLWLHTGLEYSQNKPLLNNSNYSYFFRDSRTFFTNNPLDRSASGLDAFDPYSILYTNLSLVFRPGQKYLSYPKQKIYLENTKPTFSLIWKAGITEESSFHHVAAVMRGSRELGTFGQFRYRIRAGKFLNSDGINFPDYYHPLGGEILLTGTANYIERYLNLPYYRNSTADHYAEIHLHQNFLGRILDRVPLLNKTGFYLNAGLKHLYTPEQEHYSEVHLGLSNIGIKLFRGIKTDVVFSFENGVYTNSRFVIGWNLF